MLSLCEEVKRTFDVDIFSYDRNSNGIIICSGFGIGLATMDVILEANYFFDIDNYRHKNIDWECLGIILGLRTNFLISIGFYSIDNSLFMDKIIFGYTSVNKNVFVRKNFEKNLDIFFTQIIQETQNK